MELFSVEKMYILPDAGALKAFCDIAIGGDIIIKGIRVLSGKKGLFVGLPQDQGKDSKWYDIVLFKRADLFEDMTRVVLKHYTNQGGKP
jgi:DNA-binding cell septation regulator SpoVG